MLTVDIEQYNHQLRTLPFRVLVSGNKSHDGMSMLRTFHVGNRPKQKQSPLISSGTLILAYARAIDGNTTTTALYHRNSCVCSTYLWPKTP